VILEKSLQECLCHCPWILGEVYQLQCLVAISRLQRHPPFGGGEVVLLDQTARVMGCQRHRLEETEGIPTNEKTRALS